MNADPKAREEAEAWAAGITVTYERAGYYKGTTHTTTPGTGAVPGVRDTAAPATRQDGGALRCATGPAPVPRVVERVIAFDVLGVPAPKGSSRIAHFGGRAVLVPNSSTKNAREQRVWTKSVKAAALQAITESGGVKFGKDTALYVSIAFYMPRPKAAAKRPRPNTRPDVDKLARSVLDALTGVLWSDDGRVASLVLTKLWAEPGCEGARVTVREAP